MLKFMFDLKQLEKSGALKKHAPKKTYLLTPGGNAGECARRRKQIADARLGPANGLVPTKPRPTLKLKFGEKKDAPSNT